MADLGGKTLPARAQNAAEPVRDAIRRAMRRKEQRWIALLLHLSRLTAAAARPHYARIAQVVLNEAAGQHGGQLFRLPNGDFLLLLASPDGGAGLMTMIANLFTSEAPDPKLLISRWLLPANMAQAEAYLDALPAMAIDSAEADSETELSAVATLCAELDPVKVAELSHRQTGVLLAVGGPARVLALYREVAVSLATVEERFATAARLWTDPFLHRHLTSKLNDTLLERLVDSLADDDDAVSSIGSGRPMLHLNLGVPAIGSAMFERLCYQASRLDARIGIEIALVEALADTDAFVAARERLRAAGFALILDEVTAHALAVTRPAALQADLMKLSWSTITARGDDSLDRAITGFGPNRLVLDAADSENAVRWGIARGIRRFQGRHVDAILAAARIAGCAEARACSVKQCLEREAGTTALARAGCRNMALLDAGSPSVLQLQ